MAQAIKDDRTAHAAANAAALAEARNLRQDSSYAVPAMTNPYTGAVAPPAIPAVAAQALPPLSTAPHHWANARHPAYLDSLCRLQTAISPTWVGGLAEHSIPRRYVNFATTLTNAFKFCTLLDDLEFDSNGVPVKAGTVVERQARYSWAYLVRR